MAHIYNSQLVMHLQAQLVPPSPMSLHIHSPSSSLGFRSNAPLAKSLLRQAPKSTSPSEMLRPEYTTKKEG
ncbi:MAG: hypothetical protein Q9190_007999 [Brigantiaea leucoxantha]